MKSKSKRIIPESMKCTVCGEVASMVVGVRPRTCVECHVWPPEPLPKEYRLPHDRKRKERR